MVELYLVALDIVKQAAANDRLHRFSRDEVEDAAADDRAVAISLDPVCRSATYRARGGKNGIGRIVDITVNAT